MGNGFCTYSSKEMVLLRWHLLSCAPILSLFSRLAYISGTGVGRGAEVTFSAVKKKRLGVWHWRCDNVPCVLNTFKPLEPKQPNPTAYQCCAYNYIMVHVS